MTNIEQMLEWSKGVKRKKKLTFRKYTIVKVEKMLKSQIVLK